MKTWWNARSLNQKLAVVAAVLGAVALFGQPYPGTISKVDAGELAARAGADTAQVGVDELAGWLIEGRADFRLIDVRDAEAYAAYHIPAAEQVPVAGLADYALDRNEKILLYGKDGVQAAQGWFLLQSRGYRHTYLVEGGFDAWKNQVLFPGLPENPGPGEQARIAQAQRISAFFGGQPRTGGSTAAVPEIEMPAVQAPAAMPVRTGRKKKREGC